MILTIAWREYKSLLISPLAWAILAVMQIIFAYNFFIDLESYLRNPDPQGVTVALLSPLFGWAAILLLFVMPLLTMRLLSEERRNQTMSLLLSAPISMTEIVLGKFVGVMLYLLSLIALLLLMSLSLLIGGTLDYGLLLTSLIGFILLLSGFAAIGLFMSSITYSPALAAIGTFGALFALWLVQMASEWLNSPIFDQISVISHYISFLQGTLNTGDVAYYVLFTTLFLLLSIRRLDAVRLGG
jgi:ABC-2 type transport system permease protein